MKIGRVPQTFINELINRTDIIELIDARVSLRKAGNSYKACCPFHDEKTPSFTVSQPKQFYYCFGCGAHGNAIGFLMEYDKLSFPEAIIQLATQHGLEIPTSVQKEEASESSVNHFGLVSDAAEFFEQSLRTHKDKASAVNYLKQRGLTGEIAKTYRLGFAPPGWDNLCNHLKTKGWQLEDAEEAGLVIRHQDGHYYDRFRNRVMFPIRDRRSRVLAFGGRVINPDDQPKYLNSPETAIFHKQNVAYGLFEALSHKVKPSYFLVTEGYMDVVALAQFGVTEAVATLGTAFSDSHLNQLFRECNHVYFCFDGDNAGKKAAFRALEISLPLLRENHQVSFLFMPDGDDPDSLIREIGTEAFKARIEEAMPLSEYLLQTIAKDYDLSSMDGRSSYITSLLPYLKQIPNPVYKHLIAEKLAKKTHLDVHHILHLMGMGEGRREVRKKSRGTKPEIKRTPLQSGKLKENLSAMESALSILLQQPSLAQKMSHYLQSLRQYEETGGAQELFLQVLELFCKYPHLSLASILEMWRDLPEEEYLARLAAKQWLLPEDALEQELLGALDKALQEAKSLKGNSLINKLGDLSLDELSPEDKNAIKEFLTDAKE